MSHQPIIQTESASPSRMTQEYQVLHEVAKTLQTTEDIKTILIKVLRVITQFDELKVERKAGIFLADRENKVLRLYCTIGDFTDEFLEKEKVIPFGDCLCGRVAETGQLLLSDNCFSDTRHERRFKEMTAHGHYIIPLKSGNSLTGVLFLYTDPSPNWYLHSQEVLLSIGGLIGNAIELKKFETELTEYKNHLEELVKNKTENLMEVNSRLRNLSQRLQSMREEEKTRIAREVHDELGQSLTTLRMDLLCMEKEFAPEQDAFKKRIHSQVELIEGTIKSVQRICTELRPQILDVFGFCDALAWQAKEYEKRTNLIFDLACLDKPVELDRELTTALFRIFQETITNVLRHSNATKVNVSFENKDNQLILKIKDNGKGISQEKINDPESIGLLGMRERIQFWDGNVSIQGEPNVGTSVTVTIPWTI